MITNLFQTFISCAFHFIALEDNSKKAGNQTYIKGKNLPSFQFNDNNFINNISKIISKLNIFKAQGHIDISIRTLKS